MTISKFKELLILGNCSPEPKELIRRIIRLAEKELKIIGDVFFELGVTKNGRAITHLNFIIKRKSLLRNEQDYYIRVKEDTIHLLRHHFGFKQPHITQIETILDDYNNLSAFRSKLTDLSLKLSDRKRNGSAVQNIPAWVIACIKNEFPNLENVSQKFLNFNFF